MLLASPVLPISKDRSLVIGLTDFTMQAVNVAQTLMAKKDSDPWPQWNFTCLVKVTTETILQTWPNSNHFLTISLPNIPTTVATAGSTVWKAVSLVVERPKTSQIITVRNSTDVTNVSMLTTLKTTQMSRTQSISQWKMANDNSIAQSTQSKMQKISVNATKDLLKTSQLQKKPVLQMKQPIQNGVNTACQKTSELVTPEVHSIHKTNVTNNSMDMIRISAVVSTQTGNYLHLWSQIDPSWPRMTSVNKHFFRYPYDMNENDCCRVTVSDSKANPVEVFSIQQKGVCEGAGGDIVVSSDSDPHSYINLSN